MSHYVIVSKGGVTRYRADTTFEKIDLPDVYLRRQNGSLTWGGRGVALPIRSRRRAFALAAAIRKAWRVPARVEQIEGSK